MITGDKIQFEGKLGFVEYQFNQQVSICVPSKPYSSYSEFKEAVQRSETGWMSCIRNIDDKDLVKL